MLIRALAPGEASVLRDLRLKALRNSPGSFGPTYDDALAQPDSYWESWASGRDGRYRVLVAFEDSGDPLGLVSGSVRENGVGGFGALWVAPNARGSGLGRQLVESVCQWLELQGATRIELSVTDGNPAERLYESLGFERTGDRHPLREGSPLVEVTMARTVSGAKPVPGG